MGAVMLAAMSGEWAEDKAGAETTKTVKELQEDFRKQKFGMFIHIRGSNGSWAIIAPPTSIQVERSTLTHGRKLRYLPA